MNLIKIKKFNCWIVVCFVMTAMSAMTVITTKADESVEKRLSLDTIISPIKLPFQALQGNPDSINFDVVVSNKNYTIYRSSLLGKLGLSVLKSHLAKNNLPFPKTIIYMNKVGYNEFIPVVGNFALEEYAAQEKYGFRFYHSYDYKYRTYVDGENPYEPSEDIDQDSMLFGFKARKLFGRIEDNKPDGGLDAFVRVLNLILDKSNSPVLFHCFGGRHRTGMVGLALRYLQGGQWVDGPKRKVLVMNLQKTLELNPAQYEYYIHNKDMVREENLEFIERFSRDPIFFDLQEKYSEELRDFSPNDQMPDQLPN